MTILFIPAYNWGGRFYLTKDMPEYQDAFERAASHWDTHPNCYLLNMTGRYQGVVGSYVVEVV